MRSRLLRLAACLLVILSVPATLAGFAFGLPAQYDQTYLSALQDKRDALASAEGKRIVIAGGSGAAFGLRCDLLERELPGYTAVNFGLYAGLGTTVMLELARPLLRAGDIVIFSPEQSKQTLSDFFHAPSMWQAADGRPDLLTALDGRRRGSMAGAFPAFAGDKFRLYRDNTAPAGDGVYARSSFNSCGDLDCPGREQNTMAGGFDPDLPITFDPSLPSEDFFDAVNAFARWCQAHGVSFYYRFCPMNAAAVESSELDRLDAYTAALQRRLDCPILGDPARAVLDAGWFFDTNFHLNASGAVVNTAILAGELKAALGDPTPVDITLPEQPSPAGAAVEAGDNSDGDCFTCEQTDSGLRLSGLTAEGAQRETLTLPVSRDGQPVVSLSPDLFAGNTHIRELVIQENLHAIEDGSFDGCTALERLVLRQSVPSRCTVGRDLLKGTHALVYVPAGRQSAYATDYFWAPHAARLREEAEPAPAGPDPTPSAPPAVSGPSIRYEGNGGTLKSWAGDAIDLPMDSTHLRVNTAQGTAYFRREGYLLTGWNTAPDGSGAQTGLGSRSPRQADLVLYAQWMKASPEAEFSWENRTGQAWITGYAGEGGTCVVPETLDGLPVRGICAGAFRNAVFDTLVLPPGLYTAEAGAFQGCALEELVLFDFLREISDQSFTDCSGLRTLRVNAASAPVYSGSYFDTFSDKYDWLLSLRGQKKLVLASGSSGRYGYDSPALAAAYPDYTPANMGVYAYTNALPQLELIRELMEPGDVLLSAPEFDASSEQFCTDYRLDASFWAMMESNYDAAARLDLRHYAGVLDSFGDYLVTRRGMAGRNYGESPKSYDDDGNRYAFATYNQYGDLTLPRPNGEADVCLRHNIADYTTENITPAHVEALNGVYQTFLERGIAVYFTYTPATATP